MKLSLMCRHNTGQSLDFGAFLYLINRLVLSGLLSKKKKFSKNGLVCTRTGVKKKQQPACKEKPWKRTNAQDNFTEITGKSGWFLRKYKEIRSGSRLI